MTIAIREGTAADLPAICVLGQEVNRMHHEAWPQVFAAPSDPSLDSPHWQQSIGNSNANTFVGDQAGQVVAFITVFLVTESSPLLQPVQLARVGTVCVAEHLRGRGFGRLLMQRAEQWALHRGASYLRLNVWAFNEAALRFYEELGYGIQSRILGKELPSAV
jgi:ribosomal protein S18 acetylase RimI-like enzyme